MAKGRRLIEALSGRLALLLEVRDARAPRLTASPLLDDLPMSLRVWTVLSKPDLADPEVTAEWTRHFKDNGRFPCALDLRRDLPAALKKAISDMRPSSSSMTVYREVRLAVVGIPNVGKSTLLNRLVGRRAAAVGGVPGVTRGVSWFRGQGCLVADSPGILDPRADARAHRMLSWIASTRGHVIGSWERHACECVEFLQRHDLASGVENVWGLDASGKPEDVIERVGGRLGRILPGGTVDMESSGKALMDALSAGKLGRLSLERPSSPPPWLELI